MTRPWEGTVQVVPPQMVPMRQSRNLKKKKKKDDWKLPLQVQLQGQ